MSTLSWIVGRGGLLGSAIERAIGPGTWHPEYPFPWSDPSALRNSISHAVRGFQTSVTENLFDSWTIYWCAGSGVVGTSAEHLAAETTAFISFLDQLGNALSRLPNGQVFLASSAGGVYGGSTGRPLTEATLPRPISSYGYAKLEQEEILGNWAQEQPSVSTLIGRLSNLYGLAQRLDKPQGLISHMSRCLIFSSPIRIYVPLDTIRDYLFSDDAASRIVRCMARLDREASGRAQHVTKIFSSGNETTIAGLIGVFRQIAKRQLRLVTAQSPIRTEQPAGLQFRSVIWFDETLLPRTDLLDGINRVHRHQLALFQAGRLAPPWILA